MNLKRKAFGCKEDWWVMTVVGILIIGAVLPALVGRSSYHGSRRKTHSISCISNLKQIGLSLKQYAMDYDDFFPPGNNYQGLDKLRSLDYLTDYGVYVCPGTKTKRGGKGPLTEANCDYVYLGGSKEGESPSIPLAFDKSGNHIDYVNVLFLDGHVKGYPTSASNSCEKIIIFLNKEHKYPPKLFKKLLDKAKKIDSTLPPK